MGPASIVELTRPHTARVKMEDGSERELHFNKLRPYVARIEQIGLIFDQDNEFGDLHYAPTDTVKLDVNDIYKHVMDGSAGLENPRKHHLADLLSKFSDVFSSVPGSAKVKGHSVNLMPDFVPKKLKPYRIPIALQEEVNKQINDLLQLGLIEPSESEWAHPIVCLSKKDGSVRLCVDYRLLNNVTITDAYPMQNARYLLFEIGQNRFISVLDLTKDYWQIPMKDEAKPLTAFVTHSGHYQWKVMPFGMKNAGSTFQKSMDNALFLHRKYCRSYIDDVAIY
ncbi:hypothetical protein TNCV_4189871 [Trichonephila clavipes]|nr:hypothetical protein TNCV_4189871 [Trichonephila clavipes]